MRQASREGRGAREGGSRKQKARGEKQEGEMEDGREGPAGVGLATARGVLCLVSSVLCGLTTGLRVVRCRFGGFASFRVSRGSGSASIGGSGDGGAMPPLQGLCWVGGETQGVAARLPLAACPGLSHLGLTGLQTRKPDAASSVLDAGYSTLVTGPRRVLHCRLPPADCRPLPLLPLPPSAFSA